ncbi:MAG: hypothetical protein IKH96_04725 [Ruminococcus sp.]|uniref:hypothetical protein n=1 Tax=Ruminococcus sp. TaxID=41978 RepID=UPI0025F29D86|nr:hypothetical protein [Ruminococcus sp.]MBQ6170558.1 hypothetical protein [Ruminococcus sp.]MBR6995307.1 hypothetical protein [Ruminococcus sp.]
MSDASKAYKEVREAAEVLRNAAGSIASTDEEQKLLKSFRLLNSINQKSIMSRLEGIVEGQHYADAEKAV